MDLESAGRVMTLVINDDPQPAQANYIAVSTASWRTRVDNWRYPKVHEDFAISISIRISISAERACSSEGRLQNRVVYHCEFKNNK